MIPHPKYSDPLTQLKVYDVINESLDRSQRLLTLRQIFIFLANKPLYPDETFSTNAKTPGTIELELI
jgi:hypothetical protein